MPRLRVLVSHTALWDTMKNGAEARRLQLPGIVFPSHNTLRPSRVKAERGTLIVVGL